MEKLTKKLTKLRDDFNLHVYLKRNPEKAQGMTVKEVNSLIDSLGTGEPILPGANMPQRSYQDVLASVRSNPETLLHEVSFLDEPVLTNVGNPRRSYQAVLASVKSNIVAGRAVDGREM